MSNRQLEHCLHCGRSKKPIVKIIPDSSGLYRVVWPDIGLSDIANLTRCKQAALEWAEKAAQPRDRKTSVARHLKSLDNFWWLASPVVAHTTGMGHGINSLPVRIQPVDYRKSYRLLSIPAARQATLPCCRLGTGETPQMAAHYTKRASQEKSMRSAVEKLEWARALKVANSRTKRA